MTDWKIADSSGEVHKSWYSAVKALTTDPSLAFEEQQLDMGDQHTRDVTEEVRARARSLGMTPTSG
jgi:hypothetical protein